MTAGAFIAETFARYVAELTAADEALERGVNDPESVHRARIAIRRLRSALRTFAPPLVRSWAEEKRDRLRTLSDELSAARDADIVLARARAGVESLDPGDGIVAGAVLDALIAMRSDAYAQLRASRASTNHAALLRELRSIAQRPPVADPQTRAAKIAKPILHAAYRRLHRCVRRCSQPPTDEELHAVRIAAKHVRYALEACMPILGHPASRAAKRVEHLQDVLGEEHDAALTAGRLRALSLDAGSAFVAGEIARMEGEAVERARSRWRRAWRRVKEEAIA